MVVTVKYNSLKVWNSKLATGKPGNWQRNINNCIRETKTENLKKLQKDENFAAMLSLVSLNSSTRLLAKFILWLEHYYLFINNSGNIASKFSPTRYFIRSLSRTCNYLCFSISYTVFIDLNVLLQAVNVFNYFDFKRLVKNPLKSSKTLFTNKSTWLKVEDAIVKINVIC